MAPEIGTTPPAYAIPVHVYYREVDGQLVLLNLETEEYYGLSEVGAAIVAKITEQPWDDAIDALVDLYDVDPDVLRRDADELVGKLIASGLLESGEVSSW